MARKGSWSKRRRVAQPVVAPKRRASKQRSRRQRITRPAGAWRRFVAAIGALGLMLFGIPVLLIVCSRVGLDASHPFPGIGTTDEIKAFFERDLTPTELAPIAMRVLLIAGWMLWLALAVSVLASIFEASGSSLRSWLPQFAIFAGLGRWIAAGLTAVTSLAPNFVSAGELASPRPFTISSITPERPEVEEAPIAAGFARVQRGESIETFAQRTLGDADRWQEIWELNRDQQVGQSGEVWTVAWKLGAGWDLRLPADAVSAVPVMPGERGTRPAVSSFEPSTPEFTWLSNADATVVDEYEVADGDSFWSIAERFLPDDAAERDVWTFTQALMSYNSARLGYAHPAMIHPGDVVSILAPPSAPQSAPPSAGHAAPAASTPSTHTVEAGDSYWEIAEHALGDGAAASDVVELTNDLIDLNSPRLAYDDRRMIHPGDVVYLAAPPDGETPAASPPAVDPDLDAIAIADLPPPPHEAPAATVTSTTTTTTTTTPTPPPAPPADADVGGGDESPSKSPIGIGQAALIATGVVALLAARRRARLRAAEPPARVPLPSPEMVATERRLRKLDASERLLRIDIAIRATATVLSDSEHRVVAVRCAPDGTIELHTTGSVELDEPWVGGGQTWELPCTVPVDELAPDSRSVGAPCVALAQIGVDDEGWDVLVDLEATGLLAIDADVQTADSIIRAVAVGLASSEFAEVAQLVGVGVEEDAFLGHRHAVVVPSLDEAIELAVTLIGTTATAKRSTFALRARHTSGEMWEPAVILLASSNSSEMTPAVASTIASRAGLAVVIAGPAIGTAWTLRPDGSTWTLDPIGIRLSPIGIDQHELWELVDAVEGDDVEIELPAPPVRAHAHVAHGATSHEVVTSPDASHVVMVDVGTSGGLDTVLVPTDLGEEPDDELLGTEPVWAPAANGNNILLGSNGHGGSNGHDDQVGHGVATVPFPPPPSSQPASSYSDAPWSLLVRLLGSVDVVDCDGSAAVFERSKTLELVAWLVTHRDRANRSAARTALWELAVRDATFANVVSEARRAMARHVNPPADDEWLRRTLTDELSLHDEVVADVDIARARFDVARSIVGPGAIDVLRPAVELVRDLPFSGTGYLWPDAEGITSNLVLLATNITATYGKLALAAGDVEGVFWSTGKGLNVLQGQEALIALRMRAHAEAGDLSGVRLEWESYERVINADPWSDGEPAPKLVALRKELLSR